jgi:hypothetical protein
MSKNAVREWLDTITPIDPLAARQVQRALDDALRFTLPVGETSIVDPADLMPHERDSLFGGLDDFADTVPGGLE